MDGITLALIGVLIVGLLATQRWFWIGAFGLAALACGFTVLASIFQFQILMAVGFALLACGLYASMLYIAVKA